MGTYDTLLLAFDMDNRVDEAESLWNMVLHTNTRSISKRLFSRMISLYDHHDMQDKIAEVCQSLSCIPYKTSSDIKRENTPFYTFHPNLKLLVKIVEFKIRKKQ